MCESYKTYTLNGSTFSLSVIPDFRHPFRIISGFDLVYFFTRINEAINEFFLKIEKFIKDFHVEPEKIKDKSSKDSQEDKEELVEESVTLQEQ